MAGVLEVLKLVQITHRTLKHWKNCRDGKLQGELRVDLLTANHLLSRMHFAWLNCSVLLKIHYTRFPVISPYTRPTSSQQVGKKSL